MMPMKVKSEISKRRVLPEPMEVVQQYTLDFHNVMQRFTFPLDIGLRHITLSTN
jgi:hypothetical protein